MEGAYRSQPQEAAPHADDVRWRQRAARAAEVLIALLIAEGAVEVVAYYCRPGIMNLSFEQKEVVQSLKLLAIVVCAVGEAACAWVLTKPRPSAGIARTLAEWSLRGLALAAAARAFLRLVAPELYGSSVATYGSRHDVDAVVRALVALAGLWFISSLFRELRFPDRARSARRVAVVLLLAVGILAGWPHGDPRVLVAAIVVTFGCALRGLKLVIDLKRILRVTLHEWWVDTSDATRPKWASVVVSERSRVDVTTADGEQLAFPNKFDAVDGLRELGWIEGQRAVAQGLVKQLPPSPI
jgi:hypothetical protein